MFRRRNRAQNAPTDMKTYYFNKTKELLSEYGIPSEDNLSKLKEIKYFEPFHTEFRIRTTVAEEINTPEQAQAVFDELCSHDANNENSRHYRGELTAKLLSDNVHTLWETATILGNVKATQLLSQMSLFSDFAADEHHKVRLIEIEHGKNSTQNINDLFKNSPYNVDKSDPLAEIHYINNDFKHLNSMINKAVKNAKSPYPHKNLKSIYLSEQIDSDSDNLMKEMTERQNKNPGFLFFVANGVRSKSHQKMQEFSNKINNAQVGIK